MTPPIYSLSEYMTTSNTYASDLSPEYAVLGFLAQHPAHGYELHQQLTHHLAQVWHLSLSQTYNLLNRLEARGLLTGAAQKQEKLPDRRVFRLTTAGRRRLNDWLRAPTPPSVRAVRVEFITRLYFTQALTPAEVPDLIEAQEAEIRAGIERLQMVLAELPPGQTYNQLSLQLRLRQLTSLLEWLAECRQIVSTSISRS